MVRNPDKTRLEARDSWMEAMATLTDSEDDDPVGISSLPTFKRKTGEDAVRDDLYLDNNIWGFFPSDRPLPQTNFHLVIRSAVGAVCGRTEHWAIFCLLPPVQPFGQRKEMMTACR